LLLTGLPKLFEDPACLRHVERKLDELGLESCTRREAAGLLGVSDVAVTSIARRRGVLIDASNYSGTKFDVGGCLWLARIMVVERAQDVDEADWHGREKALPSLRRSQDFDSAPRPYPESAQYDADLREDPDLPFAELCRLQGIRFRKRRLDKWTACGIVAYGFDLYRLGNALVDRKREAEYLERMAAARKLVLEDGVNVEQFVRTAKPPKSSRA
jgi:hypothetical protein